MGADRRAAGAERIYAAAAELIARDGFDQLDIESLAKMAHCSRATLYRHVGGKAQILEQVLARNARRISQTVLAAVEGLAPDDRVIEAIVVAMREIRSDGVMAQLLASRRQRDLAIFINSATIASFATENTGLDTADGMAGQWITRVIFSMLLWPGADLETEAEMLRRFVRPAFTG
ncbi:TetR/AcrR family transcriptional regulator [Mycobacterium sp. DL592]|uniref:TetR/AcrR family transcriptional regulator n=1 Tax=Mycobacterium sp. DL592 TaxID=2675524 RepID=UPI001FBAF5DA|nr:TetR/AcrR family transcriptional regulator [Mycobacterium sp. DL592]